MPQSGLAPPTWTIYDCRQCDACTGIERLWTQPENGIPRYTTVVNLSGSEFRSTSCQTCANDIVHLFDDLAEDRRPDVIGRVQSGAASAGPDSVQHLTYDLHSDQELPCPLQCFASTRLTAIHDITQVAWGHLGRTSEECATTSQSICQHKLAPRKWGGNLQPG